MTKCSIWWLDSKSAMASPMATVVMRPWKIRREPSGLLKSILVPPTVSRRAGPASLGSGVAWEAAAAAPTSAAAATASAAAATARAAGDSTLATFAPGRGEGIVSAVAETSSALTRGTELAAKLSDETEEMRSFRSGIAKS